ncbi:ergothioneine biosynthesis protein EgtB [Pseudobacteriovorax antillogorgiicola]|uniref:Ergothioneine biosynthesis protein EgtB n=1 Tax=Pseudobacteriovorax antillogorgiicola TaxID=1513793 RepID=A0A1Y6BT75_9BACT|nr:ergothioneine biosynthesis protein EgtB [Pseudobacteriovorax antillogorgiicola]TCS53932.1 ergothioneine biosynthesis protein EgtB [Pseudobacteriovorax antillogorgiicola]SMF20398.1 ergothioneine biosynthesis protein EgtB [Pseudobacteriovorax antillogorgiicola]
MNIDHRRGITDLYASTRNLSLNICAKISNEDHIVQSMPDVSPPKWHLAHTTWFFETFVLKNFLTDFKPFHEQFEYIFNSYYETVGDFHPRAHRGDLSRPALDEVREYRSHVDQQIHGLFDSGQDDENFLKLIEIGIHHEKQHQELLFMDIKHNLFKNPLYPAYHQHAPHTSPETKPYQWLPIAAGIYEIGASADGSFCYDNEGKRHRVFIEPMEIANRLVTNGEYLNFIEAGGYVRPELWLSEAWNSFKDQPESSPLYWVRQDDKWYEFTLHGLQPLDLNAPVSHVSYYEADAYARWANVRLPTEQEWEVAAQLYDHRDRIFDIDHLYPSAQSDDSFDIMGQLWQWTASAYSPYPGFKAEAGALGEYNGKFMCNQYVLRGGSIASPPNHIRSTYRNFFPSHSQWMFSGIRLAREV